MAGLRARQRARTALALIAALFLGLVVLLRGRKVHFGAPQLRFCVLIAVIGTIIPNSASYEAARHLPAGVISILLSLVPMFAFPVAILLAVDRFTWARFGGLLAGLAGVLLIVGPDASLPERAMIAAIPIALIAPMLYAVEGNVVARWGTAGLDPVEALRYE